MRYNKEQSSVLLLPHTNYFLCSVQFICYWRLEISDLCLTPKEKKNALISKNGGWILANVNCTGYYRVNYDQMNWERLLTQLETDRHVSTELQEVCRKQTLLMYTICHFIKIKKDKEIETEG